MESVFFKRFFCPNLICAFFPFSQSKQLTIFAIGVKQNIFHPLKSRHNTNGSFCIASTQVAYTFFNHQLARRLLRMIDKNSYFFWIFAHFFEQILCFFRVVNFFMTANAQIQKFLLLVYSYKIASQ